MTTQKRVSCEQGQSAISQAVSAVFRRRWQPVGSASLLILALSSQPVHAWPETPPATETETLIDLEKQNLKDLDALERSATSVLKNDLEAGEIRQDVLREVEQVQDPAQRTILLKRLTRLFSFNEDSSTAREAALSIDQGALLDRVRGMIILADAERSQNNTSEAWWSLREAQQLAMQLEKSEDVVAVFREIGTVERKLRAVDTSEKSPRLNPAPETIISEVLDHGLPPIGYSEIEFLREGGGPLREPAVFRHTYYYDGDRYYQGPNFSGGDTQVRVTHPRTGCEVSIPLKLPAGAPIIVHNSRQIEYLYPAVTVEIHFQKNGGHVVDYDNRDWKYTFLRKRLEKQATIGDPLSGGGNAAVGSVKAVAERGLAVPTAIGRRLPIISSLLDGTTPRTPGTLSAPSP